MRCWLLDLVVVQEVVIVCKVGLVHVTRHVVDVLLIVILHLSLAVDSLTGDVAPGTDSVALVLDLHLGQG